MADGLRLARTRRAVKQDSALEVLSRCLQRRPVAGDTEHLALDQLEDSVGQHNLALGEVRAAQETEARLVAEHLGAETHKVAPVDVVFEREAAKLGQRRAGPGGVAADHLDPDPSVAHTVVGRGAQQHGAALAIFLHQPERASHARPHLPVRPGGQVHHGDVADAQRHAIHRLLHEEVPQRQLAVLEPGQPDDRRSANGIRQPGLHGGVDVDVVIGGPLIGDDRPAAGVGPEMGSQDSGHAHFGFRSGGPHDGAEPPARQSAS